MKDFDLARPAVCQRTSKGRRRAGRHRIACTLTSNLFTGSPPTSKQPPFCGRGASRATHWLTPPSHAVLPCRRGQPCSTVPGPAGRQGPGRQGPGRKGLHGQAPDRRHATRNIITRTGPADTSPRLIYGQFRRPGIDHHSAPTAKGRPGNRRSPAVAALSGQEPRLRGMPGGTANSPGAAHPGQPSAGPTARPEPTPRPW